MRERNEVQLYIRQHKSIAQFSFNCNDASITMTTLPLLFDARHFHS
jgi:hypothetical protein